MDKHLGIQEIVAYDTDPLATAKLIRNLREYPELKITRAESAAGAVQGADIVTTVTADYQCIRETVAAKGVQT